ncbi:HNH endonuclease signature motif containing protein [Aeromicrobium sp. IC_218]|uniref:HNH endonuclease signature motif containing protein n=1 Tax=Aeromicrobium sp. IC_218 TaxID=2545468 RepID=UPI00103ED62A|nr:HNH endonuclease signature motif containing protein [Aeromicrobium sp. IC_218]TCJ00074.1 HNH endonuclease [Aeromicrobium sp. IC_218]
MISDQVQALLAESSALEPWTLTDREIRAELQAAAQAASALQALTVRLTAAAADRGLPREDGCTSPTVWLASTTNVSKREASKLVSLTRLDPTRGRITQERWSTGRLTTEQASIILKALDALPEWFVDEQHDDAEATLLEHASEFGADDPRRLANRIVEVVDPDSADEIIGAQLEAQEKQAWDDTHLSITRMGKGRSSVRGVLPDVQADMLKTVLEGLASPRRDGALFRDADGDHSGTEIGRLDHARRMGLALCELVEHLPQDAFPQAGGVAATVTISMKHDDLIRDLGRAMLSTDTGISASQARRLACNASLIPVVLGGASQPMDVGRAKRLHDRSQRIALAKRDGGCSWKGCDRPPGWCEAHHLVPWSEGGETSVDNGALFCFFHHHLLHDSDWSARLAADQVVEVIPPPRIDPQRRPLRHARHVKHRPRALEPA